MEDRFELLEAALDSLPQGLALVSANGEICFWNRAAETITGYAGAELIGRPAPQALAALVDERAQPESGRGGGLVHVRHKLGHPIATLARVLAVRDTMGAKIGAEILFHPAESLDALPHGEMGEGEEDAGCENLEDLEERLTAEFDDATREGLPLGVLWIVVDQARQLRQTHGTVACEAMLNRVERALRQGLRPGEHLGRWGDEEFLAIAHERNAGMLVMHARTLAGLARTVDFRWWGDRISTTVSIGAAQAEAARGETLAQLLERAKEAMASSVHAGGNRVTPLPGSETCLPL